MSDFLEKISNWFDSTHLHQQITEVDYVGLFSNPWFLVPFISMIGYMLWKKNFRDIILMTIIGAVWWASGTEYMDSLIVGNELQINKVLPVVFGGAAALGLIIYILFGRSD